MIKLTLQQISERCYPEDEAKLTAEYYWSLVEDEGPQSAAGWLAEEMIDTTRFDFIGDQAERYGNHVVRMVSISHRSVRDDEHALYLDKICPVGGAA